MADTETKRVEAFDLINEKYVQKTGINFQLTNECNNDFDVFDLWKSL